MKSKLLSLGVAVAASVSFTTAANAATVIDFDSLSNGDVVTNQFAEAIFSSSAGSEVIVTAQNLGSSAPNFICSGVNGAINCVDDVYVDFTGAVSGLSFLAVGDNDTGDIGDVRVFAGASLLGTVDIFGNSNGSDAQLVDLSAFSGITRIEIANITDGAGLGYDDFTFTVGGGAVPEPTTWMMMILGFGLIGSVTRRRERFGNLLPN